MAGKKKAADGKTADGTIKDQLDMALVLLAKQQLQIDSMKRTIDRQQQKLDVIGIQLTAATDIMATLLEVPAEMLEASYKNVLVFAKADNTRSGIIGKIKSRQDAFKRQIEHMEKEDEPCQT